MKLSERVHLGIWHEYFNGALKNLFWRLSNGGIKKPLIMTKPHPESMSSGIRFRSLICPPSFQPSFMRILSGKKKALLPFSPLRTVLESFPSYGSSLF
jgi:hypothetical protein